MLRTGRAITYEAEVWMANLEKEIQNHEHDDHEQTRSVRTTAFPIPIPEKLVDLSNCVPFWAINVISADSIVLNPLHKDANTVAVSVNSHNL
ncbi:hypothetical protein QYF36_001905 [Acer negundo]|nr:hypothetical protein QYF36_001905 [Acer negundo]